MSTNSTRIIGFAQKHSMIIPIIACIGVLYIGQGQALLLQCDGTVISAKDLPKPGNSPDVMEYTQYVVCSEDGSESTYLTEGCGQSELERGMPVGTTIHKKRGQLGYEKNGHWIRYPLMTIVQDIAIVQDITIVAFIIAGMYFFNRAKPPAVKARYFS